MADLRGAWGCSPPQGVQILSISCSFWAECSKIVCSRPLPRELTVPPRWNPGSATESVHKLGNKLTIEKRTRNIYQSNIPEYPNVLVYPLEYPFCMPPGVTQYITYHVPWNPGPYRKGGNSLYVLLWSGGILCYTGLGKLALHVTLEINPISKSRSLGPRLLESTYFARRSQCPTRILTTLRYTFSFVYKRLVSVPVPPSLKAPLWPNNLHSYHNTNAKCFAWNCNEHALISDTEVTLFTQTDDCYFQWLLDTYTVICPSYLQGSLVNSHISNESK